MVYVTDASRSVGVASALASAQQRPAFLESLDGEYTQVRARRPRRPPALATLMP